MDLKDSIKALAEDNLTDNSHFVVDVVLSDSAGPRKVLILLDGDNGVTIDDCVSLSRKVGHILEEEEMIASAYRLEVSSPGVDYPLVLARQFAKNVGRTVRVVKNDGKELKGVLLKADDSILTINKEIKKGKRIHREEVEIPLSEIEKTIVQVSFKTK